MGAPRRRAPIGCGTGPGPLPRSFEKTLDAEVLGQDVGLAEQFGGRAIEHHSALEQNDVALRDAGDVFPVLVDDDAADA